MFQNIMNVMDSSKLSREPIISEEESFIKEQIKQRLTAPDVTPEEHIELVKLYSSVSTQHIKCLENYSSRRTTKVATTSVIALNFGISGLYGK